MTLSQTNSSPASAIGQEQSYLGMLYRLLDEARARTDRALTQTHGDGGAGGTVQAPGERGLPAGEQGPRPGQPHHAGHGPWLGPHHAGPTPDPGSPPWSGPGR